MKPWNTIKKLRKAETHLGKKAILIDAFESLRLSDEIIFFEGVSTALEPYTAFGVKNIKFECGDVTYLGWNVFLVLLMKLNSGTLTDKEIHEKVAKFALGVTQEQWDFWYFPILRKDLDCGINVALVNQVLIAKDLPEIEPFEVQMASLAPKDLGTIKGFNFVDPKYSGIRCIAIIENNRVLLFSKDGEQLRMFPHIECALSYILGNYRNMLKGYKDSGIVLDGVITSSLFDPFTKELLMPDEGEVTSTEDAKFNIFDMLTLNEFKEGSKIPLDARSAQDSRDFELNNFAEEYGEYFTKSVRIVQSFCINFDTDLGRETFKKIQKLAKAEGSKGVIIKKTRSYYQKGQSSNWLEVKFPEQAEVSGGV